MPLVAVPVLSVTSFSTTFPFSFSRSSNSAPGRAALLVESVFLMTSFPYGCASFILTFWTFPVSFTVNFTSSAMRYPSGACSSRRVYSPTGSFSTICGLSVDVQLSTFFPSLSRMISFAPGTSLESAMSFLLISTLVTSSSIWCFCTSFVFSTVNSILSAVT